MALDLALVENVMQLTQRGIEMKTPNTADKQEKTGMRPEKVEAYKDTVGVIWATEEAAMIENFNIFVSKVLESGSASCCVEVDYAGMAEAIRLNLKQINELPLP